MSLIDDLRGLDLSAIVTARGEITVAVSNPRIQALLTQGPGAAALGDIGTTIETIKATLDDPAALFGALNGKFGELLDQLDLSQLPAAQYVEAVHEAARIVAALLSEYDGSTRSLLKVVGVPLGEALSDFSKTIDRFGHASLDDLGPLNAAIAAVEGGLPTSPQALAELSANILLPFGAGATVNVRNAVAGLAGDLDRLVLSATRTNGLVHALEGVSAAANTGSVERVDQALRAVEESRAVTVSTLRRELAEITQRMDGLDVQGRLEPLIALSRDFRTGAPGVIEFMDRLRDFMAATRGQIETAGEAEVSAFLDSVSGYIEQVETDTRAQLEGAIDARVAEICEWIRGLFAHLRLRPLRAEIASTFQEAANAVRAADLDRFAEEAHEQLAALRDQIQSADLGTTVRDALQAAAAAITAAIEAIVAAVAAIGAAVEALAAQAQNLLQQAAQLLRQFRERIDDIRQAIEGLGVEEAAQAVIDEVAALREKAEQLLTELPLPEPMRPLVEQLIAELEGIDLDALIAEPVLETVNGFKLPDDVRQRVVGILEAVDEALASLIPAQLISDIEAEIAGALDTLRRFDPARILGEIDAFIDDAADRIAALDPTRAIGPIRQPFAALLDVVDRAHPQRLLKPVLDAYDEALGSLAFPDAETVIADSANLFAGAGEQAGSAVMGPVGSIAGAGDPEPTAPDQTTATLPDLGGARPGDAIRMMGFIPRKLREGWEALDDGPAGEAVQAIDGLCAGLARDLRALAAHAFAVQDRLDATVEQMLTPVIAAELEARYAVETRLSLGPAELGARLDVLATASPGALRAEIAQGTGQVRLAARQTAELIGRGGVGGALNAVASALEGCRLAQVGGRVEDLLAALDPEPLAAELDALVATAFQRFPPLVAALRSRFDEIIARVRAFIRDFGPQMLLQKFGTVVACLREELAVLDPHDFVEKDLADVHAALREAVAAYDPAAFVPDIAALLGDIAGRLRAIDVAAAAGDLSFLDNALARIDEAVPADALAGVGASLQDVGRELSDLNPQDLLAAVDGLGDRISEEFERAIEAIRQEILTLLESIRFAAGSANVSAEVSVG